MKADRAWGQIVLAKAEGLDVQPLGATTGLRPIDPQRDLQPGIDASDAARAFDQVATWDAGSDADDWARITTTRSSSKTGTVIRAIRSASSAFGAALRIVARILCSSSWTSGGNQEMYSSTSLAFFRSMLIIGSFLPFSLVG